MGAETTKLSITLEANDALKKVVARFPQWSLAQLGDKLLLESCQAILTSENPVLPTVDYLRQQIGNSSSVAVMEKMVERLEKAAATFNENKVRYDEKKSQTARKRAA